MLEGVEVFAVASVQLFAPFAFLVFADVPGAALVIGQVPQIGEAAAAVGAGAMEENEQRLVDRFRKLAGRRQCERVAAPDAVESGPRL